MSGTWKYRVDGRAYSVAGRSAGVSNIAPRYAWSRPDRYLLPFPGIAYALWTHRCSVPVLRSFDDGSEMPLSNTRQVGIDF